ncbi:MFS transporter [Chloroflexota bacterium]
MIKKRHYFKIFPGWWTVIVTGILSGLGHGFTSYGISAIFKPLSTELNINRAATSVAAGISRLEGGVEGPLTGWLVDRYGPKWVIFTGICIAASGTLLMNVVNSLWAYYLVWGIVIGTGVNLALTIAVDKAIADWFINKRGLAQGIKFGIIGIITAAVLPLINWEVVEHGWRLTCLTWGGIMFAASPLVLVFVKQKRPEFYGLLPDGARIEVETKADTASMIDKGIAYASSFHEVEFSFRQAIRTKAYWIITVAFTSHSIIHVSFNIHCIPFLTDIGIGQAAAGAMMGMMLFFTVPSRLIVGFIADRVSKKHMPLILSASFTLQAAGIGLFCLNQSVSMVYIMLILYGFGSGAATPLYIVILGRYFGRKAYGSIQGTSNLIRSPLMFIAPVFAGWVYDSTGSYIPAFIIYATAVAIAGLILCMVRAPQLPE